MSGSPPTATALRPERPDGSDPAYVAGATTFDLASILLTAGVGTSAKVYRTDDQGRTVHTRIEDYRPGNSFRSESIQRSSGRSGMEGMYLASFARTSRALCATTAVICTALQRAVFLSGSTCSQC